MVRVFYLSVDPDDFKPLIYKNDDNRAVVVNPTSVTITPGGETGTYGEPDTFGTHESINWIPMPRVLEVEYS